MARQVDGLKKIKVRPRTTEKGKANKQLKCGGANRQSKVQEAHTTTARHRLKDDNGE